MLAAKCFVYVLKPESDPPHYYTGVTSDTANRLAAHCTHTARYGTVED
jgi:predicted GIY-YIG superfamily endonuclease